MANSVGRSPRSSATSAAAAERQSPGWPLQQAQSAARPQALAACRSLGGLRVVPAHLAVCRIPRRR
eukprot:11074112-Alexandrium_andersonii.AAC.1